MSGTEPAGFAHAAASAAHGNLMGSLHASGNSLLFAGAGLGLAVIGAGALLPHGGKASEAGMATRRQMRRHMSAKSVLKDARRLHPQLAALPRAQRRKLDPEEYSRLLGHWGRRRIYCGYKDIGIVVAPPQTGKTALFGTMILDSVGSVVSTSTKLDLYEATRRIRSEYGKIWLLNTEGQGGIGTNFRWSPVTGCEAPSVAMRRAAALVTASGGTGDVENGGYWVDKATELLASMLHAAAISGRLMRDVAQWAKNMQNSMAGEILNEHSFPKDDSRAATLAARAASDFADMFKGIQQGDPRTTTSVYSTLQRGLAWMVIPELAEVTEPSADFPEFDPAAFVLNCDTLFLVGENVPGSGLAPLFSTIASVIHAEAKFAATMQPGGRLWPAVSFFLDELPQIVPVPFATWAAESGGRGVSMWAAVQTISQLYDRYGMQGGATILSCANVTILFGGNRDDKYLEGISKIIGDRRVRIHTEPGQPRPADPYRRERIVPVERIAQLPPGRGLLLYRHMPATYFDYTPVWQHPAVRELRKQDKRQRRRGIIRRPGSSTESWERV